MSTAPPWCVVELRVRLDPAAVLAEHVAHGPVAGHLTVQQPHAAAAHGLDGGEVVRHEHERGALAKQIAHALEAALLEEGVADGEGLVDEQDVGLEERGDAEAQPHLHAARVELHLPVDGVLEVGEVDDLVEAAVDLLRA